MNITELTSKAEALRALHAGPEPLVLPNAWDAITAVLVAEAGFAAVATTSAGVAWALGRPDGQVLTRHEMLGAVARMAAVVTVPVTADLEAAYGGGADAVPISRSIARAPKTRRWPKRYGAATRI
jgi:2-methylisocitrate lyase-like PEP mutase family enzyme